jgi:hypothetical protein
MKSSTLAIALIAVLMCINVATMLVVAATKPPIADIGQIIHEGMNTPNIKAILQKIQHHAAQKAWKQPQENAYVISDAVFGTLTEQGITLQLTLKHQLLLYEIDRAEKAITPQNLTSPQARELMMDIRNRLDALPESSDLRKQSEDRWAAIITSIGSKIGIE